MIYNGMQIVEDLNLVDRVEDWSRVRSPGRARRRMKRGYRQNIDIIEVPKKDALLIEGKFYMHPVTAARFRQMVAQRP
jgi:hypothetical protein